MSRSVPRISLSVLFILLSVIAFRGVSLAGSGVNKPSYWISRLKSPDKVIMQPEDIVGFNGRVLEDSDQMADLKEMDDAVSGLDLYGWLTTEPVPQAGGLYGRTGEALPQEFFSALTANMNLDGIKESNEVRFGVVIERTDVRAFPTEETVKGRAGSGFDIFQYSSVYPPESVALLHTSRDGRWGFFQTPALRGWIRLDKVVFGDRDSAIPDLEDFVVVTGSYVNIYADRTLDGEALAEVPMGSVFALKGSDRKVWAIAFPGRSEDGSLEWKDAYISRKADVRKGFLSYTKRNVINQAFKMLGEEYGWGGREGKRDCSLFIKDLFATMGVKLPRNSRQQLFTGDVRVGFNEGTPKEILRNLKKAEPGVTLVGMRRHIMLFLGYAQGRPYVIHQVFGFMSGGRMKVLNKVAVTDLGASGRRKGSLKDRLKSINMVKTPRV